MIQSVPGGWVKMAQVLLVPVQDDESINGPACKFKMGNGVGNAVTDNYYDNLGTVTYWWSHAMISDRTYRQLINTCDFSHQKASNECESLFNYAMDQEFGNIDQYNIYAPPCNNSDGSGTHTGRHTIHLPHRPHPIFRQISGYDPCTEKYAEIYYNRPDVQKALHANSTKIPYKWTACSVELNGNWNDTDISILPIYRELIAAGLRIWVFRQLISFLVVKIFYSSGDIDSVVPVTATRYSLAQLKLPTKIPWYPWYVKKQSASPSSSAMSQFLAAPQTTITHFPSTIQPPIQSHVLSPTQFPAVAQSCVSPQPTTVAPYSAPTLPTTAALSSAIQPNRAAPISTSLSIPIQSISIDLHFSPHSVSNVHPMLTRSKTKAFLTHTPDLSHTEPVTTTWLFTLRFGFRL
ncbi:hypothetical protein HYC85_004788 [Camellia sinensis]|uniref:Uncharacterized protein n=1 Tax=Camellia sinensis TaxID=4442 RepID=A0A7J7HXH3_CAMSI|nr:hypothetical protein HYC85_004788 [Camellia sinensis]